MNRRTRHREVPVKVNAWVDRAIVPLVEALNEFPNIWTTSSCEGHNDFAHVTFACRGTVEEFATLVEHLSGSLGTQVETEKAYRIQLEWVAGGERPLGTLVVHRHDIQSMAVAIRRIATNGGRKNRSLHGTRDTRPRNSTDYPARRHSVR